MGAVASRKGTRSNSSRTHSHAASFAVVWRSRNKFLVSNDDREHPQTIDNTSRTCEVPAEMDRAEQESFPTGMLPSPVRVPFDAVVPSIAYELKQEPSHERAERHVSFAIEPPQSPLPKKRGRKKHNDKRLGKNQSISRLSQRSDPLQVCRTPAEELKVARAEGRLDMVMVESSQYVPDMEHAKANAFRTSARYLLSGLGEKHLHEISSIVAKLSIHEATSHETRTSSKMASSPTKAAKALPAPAQQTRQVDPIANRQMVRASRLQDTRVKGKERLRELKQHGQHALTQAYATGRLEEVMKEQTNLFPDSHLGKVAQFREIVRQTLLDSESDGRLEILVLALGWTFNDIEPCRGVFRKSQVDAKVHPLHFGWVDRKACRIREAWVDGKLRSIHEGRRNALVRILDAKLRLKAAPLGNRKVQKVMHA